MKKASVFVSLASILLFSCYDSTSDFSRVILFISPPADVTKIHVGAFLGVESQATLIMKETYNPTGMIPMIIPSGKLVSFAIWAESSSTAPVLFYYGSSVPVIMEGQDFALVPMELNRITEASLDFHYIGAAQNYSWNAVPGALRYEIFNSDGYFEYGTTANFYHYSFNQQKYIFVLSDVFGTVSPQYARTDW